MRMFAMFACKRSQIISVLSYYLLAGGSILAFEQMVAKFHLSIFTVRSTCGYLMAGEAIVTLARSSIESEDILLSIAAHDSLGWQSKTLLAACSYLSAYIHTCEKLSAMSIGRRRMQIALHACSIQLYLNSNGFRIIVKVLVHAINGS